MSESPDRTHRPSPEVARSEFARRRAESSQRQAEEHFDRVIAGVRDYAIFLLDVDGRVITWNAGAERIKGYRADEIVGQHFSRFYPPDAQAAHWPERELELAAQTGSFENEGWRLRKDGSRFWANVVVTPLRDEAENLRGFLKITRDLTERRRADEALRESEECFRLMVDGVRDYAIFMLDPEGRVVTWNTGAKRLKGYRADEIVGQHFSRFYPQEAIDRGWPQYELQEARRVGRFEDEGWRLRSDGSRFWANVVITALHDPQGELRGYSKVTRDLTERRQAEIELQRAAADLERRVEERTRELAAANAALRAEVEQRRRLQDERERLTRQLRERVAALDASDRHKNEFLAMLGHELRNPLAPIRNALEILKLHGVGETTRDQARGTIERQVQHLVRLVDDLLDVSRIMQGKIDLRRERVELEAVIGRALEIAQPAVDANRHELLVSLPAAHVELEGDLIRLAQVVGNLLVNAAKYTTRAGQIELRAEAGNGELTLQVRDNGIGIAPELLPRVFDFFVQGSRSLERAQGGLGIGLTLVKRLVEMHGGTVAAASDGPGRGSTFTVTLPIHHLASREDRSPSRDEAIPERRRRVLVVDDNVDAAESAAAMLTLWGHDVRAIHDGTMVLDAVRDQRPEVVLLDIGLPGRNGYDVARELRALADSPVRLLVAMTGYGQDEDRRRSAEAGFDVHLTKPIDPQQLRELIASVAD
ncbi:MAG TPA: PAS domain S-box protein [Thermoanaerobaculia bacterium]|jgi:PAS domain S-box-containing protein|nr:PAS domain S-box protein [Thermoanaerobaculia bacterium]